MLITTPDLPLIDRLTSEPGGARNSLDWAAQKGIDLATGLVILLITIWLAGLLASLLKRSLTKFATERHHDTTLANFLSSLTRYGILIIGLIAALQTMGVAMTSILAVLGAASLAVGLAMQGALSNVAAGVMLLILRPYRIGDLVEIGGKKGKVRGLDLFVTELTAPDGLRLIVPNAKVLGDMIINYTASGRRRLELKFRIDYADDVDTALRLLLEEAQADKRVFKDPKPLAQVTALEDSGVIVTLFAWTNDTDFYTVGPDLIGRIKVEFEQAGLTFPYPHQVGITRAEQAKIRPRFKSQTVEKDTKTPRRRKGTADEAPPGETTAGA